MMIHPTYFLTFQCFVLQFIIELIYVNMKVLGIKIERCEL